VTPLSVSYTGLEFDPGTVLRDRCIRGVIPPDWQRHRFAINGDATSPVSKLSRWLHENIEGCWAIYGGFPGTQRQVTIAFEHDFDAMTFMMADGKTQALRSS
jgi:hypothetical protein